MTGFCKNIDIKDKEFMHDPSQHFLYGVLRKEHKRMTFLASRDTGRNVDKNEGTNVSLTIIRELLKSHWPSIIAAFHRRGTATNTLLPWWSFKSNIQTSHLLSFTTGHPSASHPQQSVITLLQTMPFPSKDSISYLTSLKPKRLFFKMTFIIL